ncbi:MAG: NADH-quinone oxidoreductase subunit L, partial [Gammaproteobacteria bacterium]|nr:NADH-quinone oxidoreductase subunit L [Gammaproteobacteria bacterium]
IAVILYMSLDSGTAALQFAERLDLPGPLDYHTGADGITTLFVLAGSLLVFLVCLYSLVRGLTDIGRLLAVVLALEAVLMSALTTVNLLWFVLAWGVDLALVGYMLWYWSTSPNRDRALRPFYQFQFSGLLLLLLGTLLAGYGNMDMTGKPLSYDLADLSTGLGGSPLATMIFLLLFLGIAIRAPMFPFHGWLPMVARYGNIAMAPAFLLGVKISIYGLVRFVVPMVPSAVHQAGDVVMIAAVAGVFYSAILAARQTNLRHLMSFAVVSHTGLLVLGVFTLDAAALQGSLLLSVTFGLAILTMLFMLGLVYRRIGSTNLSRLGGLFDRLPVLATAFFIGGLAIMCMPGTPGFAAAHLVFEGSMHHFGALATMAVALGNVTAAGMLLWSFQRAFLGPAPAARREQVESATGMELFIAVILILVLLAAGFYMDPWLELIEAPTHLLDRSAGAG